MFHFSTYNIKNCLIAIEKKKKTRRGGRKHERSTLNMTNRAKKKKFCVRVMDVNLWFFNLNAILDVKYLL